MYKSAFVSYSTKPDDEDLALDVEKYTNSGIPFEKLLSIAFNLEERGGIETLRNEVEGWGIHRRKDFEAIRDKYITSERETEMYEPFGEM